MDHEGNRVALSVFVGEVPKPWGGPYFPYSPKGEVPKPWEGPYFLYFILVACHFVKTWTTKIGEIGALSVFSLGEVPKPWEGPYFPYFP